MEATFGSSPVQAQAPFTSSVRELQGRFLSHLIIMMDGPQGSGHLPPSVSPTLNWDQFCDVLDGTSWDALMPRPGEFERSESAGDRLLLKESLSGRGQYFFDTNLTKQAIENFCLKVSLCGVLCRHLSDVHERTDDAYVGLDPSRVVVTIPISLAMALPLRWACSLGLRNVSEMLTPQLGDMPPEMARGLTAVPAGLDLSYAAPMVRAWPLGRELSVTALVQSADAIPDDAVQAVQGLVRVHLITDTLSARECSDRDVFRILLPSGITRGGTVNLWARKVDAPERGIVVSGLTDSVSAAVWTSFSQAGNHVRSTAEVAVYRSFSSVCDLYSCGLLLLRALLGSKDGRWERVLEVWPDLLDGLPPLVQGLDQEDACTIHERIRDRLLEWGDLFQPGELAEALWYDAFVAVLRACTGIQGFSYGLRASVLDHSAVRAFGYDLDHLSRRGRAELFEREEHDALIVRACDRALTDLGARF